MGQNQSTSDGDGATPQDTNSPAVKQDYYELLGVERTATDEELKKAYRRKALELHPDRNYGNVDDATRQFAEVQSAYEVLSDAQERAWYDSHRDVLLRGDAGGQPGEEFSYNMKMTTAEDVLKLMMKFNGRLEFTDAPSGFYGGLNEFFDTLAKEEEIACQWEEEDPLDYPEFGVKDDDYEDLVRPFYAAWAGFATRKSFAWKDQYRLSDAPDRRIRRLMEKENRKLRDEAVQEFNDAVRSLVAFVRKRDPRVRNNQKSEAERQKALRDAAAAQAARARAAQQAKNEELDNFVVPEWAQSRTKDEYEGGFSSESDIEEHQFDCVVCDKTFKSEAQYKAHEKSKKHVKLLKQLKKEMRKEGHELELEGKNQVDAVEPVDDDDNDDDNNNNSDRQVEPKGSAKHKSSITASSNADRSRQTSSGESEDGAREEESESEEDSDYAPRAQVESRLTSQSNELDDADITESELIQDLQQTKISPSSNHKSIDMDSDEEGSIDTTTPTTTALGSSSSTTTTKTPSDGPKLGKAKAKRLKKAAANSATSSSTGGTTPTYKSEFTCAICANSFESKTQLFKHIKDKGHAAPLIQIKTDASASASGAKGKKKKR